MRQLRAAFQADGNMTEVDGGSSDVYTYNALNQRVRIDWNGGGQFLVFGLNDQRTTTWNTSDGSIYEGVAYWGVMPVEYYDNGYAHFESLDWTGTKRMSTNNTGAVEGAYASYLFGDGLTNLSGSDYDGNHFAGLDADNPAEMSHAKFRQYSNTRGQWYSPAPYLATYDPTNLHFYLNDWLGTRRVQTDYSGVVEQDCMSLPYGDSETCGPTPAENLFTGKARDAETAGGVSPFGTNQGNDYFGARYYASVMGRWLSPDYGAGPVPYASFTDPQSLNLYSYVGNNPLGGVDADGHCDGNPDSGCEDRWQQPGESVQQVEDAATSEMTGAYNDDQYTGDDTLAAQQQSSSNSSGALTDYVSVSDWPTGAGGFHHTGVAVDSDDTHGFSTANPNLHWWQRLFGAPKGRMEDDIDMHKNSDGVVARHSYIHIPITAEQAAAMRAAIADRTANPGRYNLIFRNCAGALESILHAGGVSGIPHGEVNIPFVLHDILLLERGSQ